MEQSRRQHGRSAGGTARAATHLLLVHAHELPVHLWGERKKGLSCAFEARQGQLIQRGKRGTAALLVRQLLRPVPRSTASMKEPGHGRRSSTQNLLRGASCRQPQDAALACAGGMAAAFCAGQWPERTACQSAHLSSHRELASGSGQRTRAL